MKTSWIKGSRPRSLLVLFGLALVVGSCYPGDVPTTGDLDVVATFYDKALTYVPRNFAMPDSIVQLNADDPDAIELPRTFDQQILDLVAQNMKDLGYTRVDTSMVDTTDVVILVSAVATNNWSAYLSYPWWPSWGWWGGWPCCGPGWGWWYPCCATITNYQVGTLFIEYVDLSLAANLAPGEMELPVTWAAAINGLLSGSQSGTGQRLTETINQAFAQSPYLAGNSGGE